MAEELRALNDDGRKLYREWLEQLKQEPSLPTPPLLSDSATAYSPLPGVELPRGPFSTKLELAVALLPLVEQLEAKRISENRWPGIWDGLALHYFNEICPVGGGGARKVGELERYYWDSRHIRFYKHRLAAPVTLFRVHGESAIVFLCGGPSVLSDYEIQICSRQEWMSCRSVGEVCCLLYWDPKKRATKRGGMSKKRGGALFHLIRVIQHLERTYDLQGMTGNALATLLPKPFNEWINQLELLPSDDTPSAVVQEYAGRYSAHGSRNSGDTVQETLEATREDLFSFLQVGGEYTRDELAVMWGYESYHAIARGVVTPRGKNVIILFVTETSARTGAEHYENALRGNVLSWEGPDDHFAEERMVRVHDSDDRIHLFYREVDRTAFRYCGDVTLLSYALNTDRPSRFTFELKEWEGER